MSVTIHTKTGLLKIELSISDAFQSRHVENFLRHCAMGNYNTNNILRYIPDFILQMGDPSNSGKQSDAADIQFPTAFSVEDKSEESIEISRGSVLTVNNPKNIHQLGSQFFIVLSEKYKDTLSDKEHYTVIGRLIDGFESLEKLEMELNAEESTKKNGKIRGKWKKEHWIKSVEIHFNPYAI